MDNDLNALSEAISKIEIALHDYVLFPKSGLEQLKVAIASLHKIAVLDIDNELFLERLSFYIKAVDVLLSAGAIYSNKQQCSLLSCADALIQFAISFQFGEERSRQFVNLLSSERECWQDLFYIVEESASPTYVNYKGRWGKTLGFVVKPSLVDDYLSELSKLGIVSFHYESIESSSIDGYFLLQSAQSLSWLQQRFSDVNWMVVHSKNGEEAIEDLCKLTFLPIFQNEAMSRQSKYRLLDVVTRQSKAYLYKKFETVFPTHFDLTYVDEPSRLVPCTHPVSLNWENVRYFPIRAGGVFYLGVSDLENEAEGLTSLSYLGRDFLSSFLYEVKTKWGRFVFDCSECLGVYPFSSLDASLDGVTSIEVSPDMSVKLIEDVTVFLLEGEVDCSLWDAFDVLVVRQAGKYFAIPYLSIREFEGVCALNCTLNHQVKNIWQDSDQNHYLEPWLIPSFNLSDSFSVPLINNQTPLIKSGYYQGRVEGLIVWIEADLVSEILPYKASSHFGVNDIEDLYINAFLIHEGVCFDKVIALDEVQDGNESNKFTVILSMSQKSLVLQLSSCEWITALPDDIDSLDNLNLLLDRGLYKNQINKLASLQGKEFIINSENYLSYIDDISQFSLLA